MKRWWLFASAAACLASFGAAVPTVAADMPTKAPPRAAAQSWTGCHAGFFGGYQWVRSRQDYAGLVNGVPNAFLPTGTTMASYDVDGGHVGGALGCDYQTGNWVFGIEGDGAAVLAQGRSLADPAAVALGLNRNFEFTTEQKWAATVRGRIGYAWDRWMVYGTGGLVVGGFELNNQNSLRPPTATRIPDSLVETGWIAGLGAEYALSSAFSIRSEVLYFDYGTIHYGDAPGITNGCTAGCANADVPLNGYLVKLGINWKFM